MVASIKVSQGVAARFYQCSRWTSGRIHVESYGFNGSGNLELTMEPDFAYLMSFLVLIKTL